MASTSSNNNNNSNNDDDWSGWGYSDIDYDELHALLVNGNGADFLTVIENREIDDGAVVEAIHRRWPGLMVQEYSGGNLLIHIAVEKNLELIAAKLVDVYPKSAYAMNHEGVCPLYGAVTKEFTELVKRMLRNMEPFKEEALAFLSQGNSVLHAAVCSTTSEILEHLIESGVPVDGCFDERGRTPLSYAAYEGKIEAVKVFLRKSPNSAFKCNWDGLSYPIDLARQQGHMRVIELLGGERNSEEEATASTSNNDNGEGGSSVIDGKLYWILVTGDVYGLQEASRADVLQLTYGKDENTVLHIAAILGQIRLVQLIRTRCPELMAKKNKKGDLPIHAALAGLASERIDLKYDVAFELVEYDSYSPLTTYAIMNHKGLCPLYLAITNGFVSLSKGKSLLHAAVSSNTNDTLKLIIDKAPRLVESLFDSRGRSPLSYAAYIGYAEGVSLLLNHDPNLEFKKDNDRDGSFPIHYAAKGGHPDVMKLFKLSENLVNNNTNNQNALHLAAESGRLGAVVYLLKQAKFKKLLNAGDANGNTPLHLAVKGFHHQVVRCLLAQKNVDVNSINKELLTPRDILQRQSEYRLGVSNGYTFDVKIQIMVALLKKAKGEISNVKEKADDSEATNKIGITSKKGNAPNWEKAHMLLVVATLMIGLSYAVIASLAEESSVKGNGLFSISLFVTFYAAICASLFLLGAAMIERVSTNFLYLGAILIYVGLLGLTFSGMAAIYNIHNVPNTNWTALSIGLVVSAMVCITLVMLFPFYTFSYYFRVNLATTFLPYCCACFGEKKDNPDDFGI